MGRRRIDGSRIFLTGASRGIGQALAIRLAEKGAKLVLLGRDAARLAEVAERISVLGIKAIFFAGDITEAPAREEAIAIAKEQLGGIDILINNAGIGSMARFDESDEKTLRHLMEVNFFAPVELLRIALPILGQGNGPLVVQVGSILGRRGTPFCSAYCASKFALQGFSESLRAELAGQGIDLMMVNPGPTETGFGERRIGAGPSQPKNQPRRATADHVALAIVRGIERGSHEIVPSWPGRLLLLANRISPWLGDAIVARFAESD